MSLFSSFKKKTLKKRLNWNLRQTNQKGNWLQGCSLCRAVTWPAALLTGTPVRNNVTGVVGYEMQGPLQYLVWYHAVGLIWITEFIFAFQQMTIAGAVVTYYFTRWVWRPQPIICLHPPPSSALSRTNQLPVLFQCDPWISCSHLLLSPVTCLWNVKHALLLWCPHSWSGPSWFPKRSSTFK